MPKLERLGLAAEVREQHGQDDEAGADLARANLAAVAGLVYAYDAVADVDKRAMMIDAAVDIRRQERAVCEGLIRIGARLAQLKEVLIHGHFLAWTQQEFGYSRQTVNEFIHIAERFGGTNVRQMSALCGHLNERILRLLAAPSVPDAVVEVVMEEAAAGRRVTVREVKTLIAEHKAAANVIIEPLTPRGRENIDVIEADYRVIEQDASMNFAAWIAAMPPAHAWEIDCLELRQCLALAELAKAAALRARGLDQKLYNFVGNVLPPWSQLIYEIEKRLRA